MLDWRRPLVRGLLLTAAAIVPLGALTVWAAYGPWAAGSEAAGRVTDGVREIPLRVYAWGFSPRVVRVNPDETVRFSVVTDDIQHGFAINELGINLQLARGRAIRSPDVRVSLPPGKYAIHCSVFCGLGHPSMKASLIVGDPGPAPSSRLPWIASALALAAAGAFAVSAAGARRPGA